MKQLIYIEDFFKEFVGLTQQGIVVTGLHDQTVIDDFGRLIDNERKLTRKQKRFILILLGKYKSASTKAGLNYQDYLDNPLWKLPSREISIPTRKVWIEEGEDTLICLQYHRKFKDLVEQHILKPMLSAFHRLQSWNYDQDSGNFLRKLSIYNITNLLTLTDLLRKHRFEIDDTLSSVESFYEEVLNQQDNIVPYFTVTNSAVNLVNADSYVLDWWNSNKTTCLNTNILLAKAMGFVYKGTQDSLIKKIAAEETNQFWVDDVDRFLQLAVSIQGQACIIIDRTSDIKEWTESFVRSADKLNIDRKLIGIHFKDYKKENLKWAKSYDLEQIGDQSKFLIVQHQPDKHLIEQLTSIKIIATNNIYPSTSKTIRDWFTSHPCVVYLGTIRPSQTRNRKIAKM